MAYNDRFKDAPWVTGDSVIVGGAGGIGSWLTLFLSRIGYDVHLFDDDNFEEHNMGGQFVNIGSIGNPKVGAVQDLVDSFGGRRISTYNQRITGEGLKHYFSMSAFDNMEARKAMFKLWSQYLDKEKPSKPPLLIDGRLTLEQIQIFCVTPATAKEYEEKHLFDDSEVGDAACTMKQTSHTEAIIAGLMTGFFTNHVANIQLKNEARTVPFSFEYFVPLNLVSDVTS